MQSQNRLLEKSGQILSEGFLTRFWSKVNKTESCWLWTASVHHNGYGQIYCKVAVGKTYMLLAHRCSWIIAHGFIPDGLQVLHNCPGKDNKACVNPSHLWLGDHTDNGQDASKKGVLTGNPFKAGEGHPMAVLNDEVVRAIRLASLSGMNNQQLGVHYGVSSNTIRNVVIGHTWKHVTPSPPTTGVLLQGQLL